MHCPECAAVVSPLREFCPHCGTSLHRDPREDLASAPAGRSEEELKRNRRRVLVVGAGLLLAFGAIGKISWLGPAIHLGSRHQPRGPAVVDAEEFFQSYRRNAHAANKEFRHREMLVTGEFVRIAPDGNGDPDLRLKTSDPATPLGIDLIRASHQQATQLRAGQTVTVSCEGVGRTGEERWLRNCAIQTVRDGAASASPPSPAVAPSPHANKS